MLELYYFPDNASLAPHLLLAETNLELLSETCRSQIKRLKVERIFAVEPAGRIPTLVHNELVLFESPAICIYICELDEKSQFIPPL